MVSARRAYSANGRGKGVVQTIILVEGLFYGNLRLEWDRSAHCAFTGPSGFLT
jgi:hypothetical protein